MAYDFILATNFTVFVRQRISLELCTTHVWRQLEEGASKHLMDKSSRNLPHDTEIVCSRIKVNVILASLRLATRDVASIPTNATLNSSR